MRSRVAKTALILLVLLVVAIPTSVSAANAWVHETVTLAPGDYYPYSYYCFGNATATFTLNINVTSGDPIAIIMMSQAEYSRWLQGQATGYVRVWGVAHSDFNYTIPYTYYPRIGLVRPYIGNYYIILDNSESQSVATVQVTITYAETPSGPQSVDTPPWLPLIPLGVIGAIAVVFIVLHLKYNRQ